MHTLQQFKLIFIFCFVFSVPFMSSAQQTKLYLEPFQEGPAFKTAPTAEIESLNPLPIVLDQETSLEWFWVEYPGVFGGYVRSTDVNKDLTLKNGALVYTQNNAQSPILASAISPESVNVLDLEGDWVSVKYNGSVQVYFRDPSLAAAPVADIPIDPVEEIPPLVIEDTTQVEITEPPVETFVIRDEPVRQPAPLSDSLEIFEEGDLPVVTKIEAPIALEKGTPRYFEGRLVRTNSFVINPFKKERYNYALIGAKGSKIAYVDIKGLIISGPLEKFFDQQVIIQGVAEKTKSTQPLILHAHNILLK